MSWTSLFQPGWAERANAAMDSILYRLSVYGAPVAIGVVSLVALVVWESQYPVGGDVPISFRVLETHDALQPAQARNRVSKGPLVSFRDTKLSESPFWFVFAVQPNGDEPTVVELPSRHAIEASCWNAASLTELGSANRKTSLGRLKSARGGFAVHLGRLEAPVTLLCRETFSGPARLSVAQWPASKFEKSIAKFNHDAGLLEGGLIVLAIFVLLTAIINREWLYVLFAAWLVANLRLAAMSAGWDVQWLGQKIPPDWMFLLRKLNMAAYYVLTIALFSRLFSDDLKRAGYAPLLRVTQWSCLPLPIAVTLAYAKFLPYLWVSAAFSVAVIVFFLARILLITRSRVAIWYGASLGIALIATFNEIISAAFGAKWFFGTVNSVTAALSSSLMAALALAEQIRLERLERLKAQAELRNAYEATPIGLFTLDANGVILRGNPALREMLGIDPDTSHKLACWSDYFEPDAWVRLMDMVRRGATHEIEIRSVPVTGGEEKLFLVRATSANDKIEGSLQDITERAKATEKLRFLAENDPLTNTLNRISIEKLLEKAIRGLASGRPLALGYLDLDRFKLINDLFGHLAGDEVLRQVCQRAREMLAPGQVIGRVGGDEFVLVLQDTNIQSATWTCRGIIERIGAQPYQIGDKAFQVRGSIGLIEVAGDTKVSDEISVADLACREAKKGHRGNLVVYEKNAPVFRDREEELRLIERFGVGAPPEGLFLVMQPIMSLRNPHDSLNFEVLLRMREADNSIKEAGKIIVAAESNGRVAVIDRWVLVNTLEWLAAHCNNLAKTQFVCVNLSGGSLNDERFIRDAYAILSEYGRTAERLCIEITESVALHDLENTKRFIDKMRSFGAKIALDDFGAGYTSFNYLRDLPADVVKIDGAFVRDINSHPANLSIVQAIVELTRDLGMRSIAEWAEDLATVEALATIGADYVQGYVIAKPQHPGRILLADSSASFIQDARVAQFVRDTLGHGIAIELGDLFDDATGAKLH